MAIDRYLTGADWESVSPKDIRQKLEIEFGQDLSNSKVILLPKTISPQVLGFNLIHQRLACQANLDRKKSRN